MVRLASNGIFFIIQTRSTTWGAHRPEVKMSREFRSGHATPINAHSFTERTNLAGILCGFRVLAHRPELRFYIRHIYSVWLHSSAISCPMLLCCLLRQIEAPNNNNNNKAPFKRLRSKLQCFTDLQDTFLQRHYKGRNFITKNKWQTNARPARNSQHSYSESWKRGLWKSFWTLLG